MLSARSPRGEAEGFAESAKRAEHAVGNRSAATRASVSGMFLSDKTTGPDSCEPHHPMTHDHAPRFILSHKPAPSHVMEITVQSLFLGAERWTENRNRMNLCQQDSSEKQREGETTHRDTCRSAPSFLTREWWPDLSLPRWFGVKTFLPKLRRIPIITGSFFVQFCTQIPLPHALTHVYV